MLQEAKEVCPTTVRRLMGEDALLVDVREPREVQALAFDVPDILYIQSTWVLVDHIFWSY